MASASEIHAHIVDQMRITAELKAKLAMVEAERDELVKWKREEYGEDQFLAVLENYSSSVADRIRTLLADRRKDGTG